MDSMLSRIIVKRSETPNRWVVTDMETMVVIDFTQNEIMKTLHHRCLDDRFEDRQDLYQKCVLGLCGWLKANRPDIVEL